MKTKLPHSPLSAPSFVISITFLELAVEELSGAANAVDWQFVVTAESRLSRRLVTAAVDGGQSLAFFSKEVRVWRNWLLLNY